MQLAAADQDVGSELHHTDASAHLIIRKLLPQLRFAGCIGSGAALKIMGARSPVQTFSSLMTTAEQNITECDTSGRLRRYKDTALHQDDWCASHMLFKLNAKQHAATAIDLPTDRTRMSPWQADTANVKVIPNLPDSPQVKASLQSPACNIVQMAAIAQ